MCWNVTFFNSIITCCKNGSFIVGQNIWLVRRSRICDQGQDNNSFHRPSIAGIADDGGHDESYFAMLIVTFILLACCVWVAVLYTSRRYR